MKLFYIIDNRRPRLCNGFDEEASLSSLMNNIFTMLASYQVMAEKNSSWLQSCDCTAVAASPTTCRLLTATQIKYDINLLKEALVYRFTGVSIKQTWA